jgi:hypothetical protein
MKEATTMNTHAAIDATEKMGYRFSHFANITGHMIICVAVDTSRCEMVEIRFDVFENRAIGKGRKL